MERTVESSRETPAATGHMDSALIDRLRAGEDAAFDELVAWTAGRLMAVAKRMLGSEDDARDAVQEAYLNAFRSLDRFDGRSQLSTWLHRITVNVCLMKLRSSRRRPERRIEDLLPKFKSDGHQEIPARAWNPPIAAGIEDRETLAIVRKKMDEIPDSYRVVMILRDVEGLDTEETARVLGVTPNAVKTRLHRAHQALRELLDAEFSGSQP